MTITAFLNHGERRVVIQEVKLKKIDLDALTYFVQNESGKINCYVPIQGTLLVVAPYPVVIDKLTGNLIEGSVE